MYVCKEEKKGKQIEVVEAYLYREIVHIMHRKLYTQQDEKDLCPQEVRSTRKLARSPRQARSRKKCMTVLHKR
jgi:hypothetical protein